LKPVRLSGHAKDQLASRGVTESEIIEAITNERWRAADRGRLECRKDFAFGKEWNGKMYAVKQVRPVFVDEPNEIVCCYRIRLLLLIEVKNENYIRF
jgi:hypothetical protein